VLFTDFGLDGPYTGQMKAVLHQMAPNCHTAALMENSVPGNRLARRDIQRDHRADEAPSDLERENEALRREVMEEEDGRE